MGPIITLEMALVYHGSSLVYTKTLKRKTIGYISEGEKVVKFVALSEHDCSKDGHNLIEITSLEDTCRKSICTICHTIYKEPFKDALDQEPQSIFVQT